MAIMVLSDLIMARRGSVGVAGRDSVEMQFMARMYSVGMYYAHMLASQECSGEWLV